MSQAFKNKQHDLRGQYPLDIINGEKNDPDNILAHRDGDAGIGFHDERALWDQEDRNPDIATGNSDRLPDDMLDNGLDILPDHKVLTELGGVALDDDPTARWIKAIEAGDNDLAADIAQSFNN